MASAESLPVSLSDLRERRGLRISHAAVAMGVHHTTLRMAEAGIPPRIDARRRIAAFYEVEPEAIWPVEEPEAA